ncbi:MAG: hypothetical protein DRR42_24870, partial [Gammaproteobacteria bacterium]
MSSSANLVTPLSTLSYVKIWVAEGFKNDDGTRGVPKYQCTFVIPKTEDVSAIVAAHAAVLAADFPEGLPYGARPGGLIDGAVRYPTDPFYADKWVLGTSQDEDRFDHDQVMDKTLTKIVNKSHIYSGCIGHGMISFYGYKGGSKGIGCSLHGIVKMADGEHLGGGAVDSKAGFAAALGVSPAAAAAVPPAVAAAVPPAAVPPAAVPPAAVPPVAPAAHV